MANVEKIRYILNEPFTGFLKVYTLSSYYMLTHPLMSSIESLA